MARYIRTYTYTGQTNRSGSMSVNISRFSVVERDASNNVVSLHSINQIYSITYYHWHTTTGTGARSLKGRLHFGDGTYVDSNIITNSFSSNEIQYTNTFSAATGLPTPQQFENVVSIETIRTNGGGGTLYWRATSSQPMRIVVEFDDVPPVTYNPELLQFDIARCLENGQVDQNGEYVRATLKTRFTVQTGTAYPSGFSCLLYYAQDGGVDVGNPNTSKINLLSKVTIDQLLAGVSIALSPNESGSKFASGSSWSFALEFAIPSTSEKAPVVYKTVGKTFAPMAWSVDGKHFSFGGMPTYSGNTDTFEVRSNAYFDNFGDVYEPTMFDGFVTPGAYGDKLRLIRVGQMVFINGTVQRTKSGSTILFAIGEKYAPKTTHSYILGVGTGNNIARICVHPPNEAPGYVDPYVSIEWYHATNTTTNDTNTFTWLSISGMWFTY